MDVMDVMTNLRQYYSNSHKITKREDISNPFDVLESQTLEVENIVEKNRYLTILFFSQLYTHLHTCQKSHPCMCRVSLSVQDMRLPVIIISDCWEYIIELECTR